METLLHKVQRTEGEARERISQVEEKGKSALADLLAAEESVLEEVRAQAEKRAAVIIKEQVQQAGSEVNAMRQDKQKSLEAVGAQSQANRQGVTTRIIEFFEEAYL